MSTVWIPTIVAGTAAAGVALRGVLHKITDPQCKAFGKALSAGIPARHSVAITFDDGPSESTPRLLDVLDRYGALSTFFQCGANVERIPEISALTVAAGHEIGNHSFSHPYLALRSKRFIFRELDTTQQLIKGISGKYPVLFRPPYGMRSRALLAVQAQLGLTTVLWSSIACDWKWPVERILQVLMPTIEAGAIICMHDGRRLERNPNILTTVRTLSSILSYLDERDYQFETVSQIVKIPVTSLPDR